MSLKPTSRFAGQTDATLSVMSTDSLGMPGVDTTWGQRNDSAPQVVPSIKSRFHPQSAKTYQPVQESSSPIDSIGHPIVHEGSILDTASQSSSMSHDESKSESSSSKKKIIVNRKHRKDLLGSQSLSQTAASKQHVTLHTALSDLDNHLFITAAVHDNINEDPIEDETTEQQSTSSSTLNNHLLHTIQDSSDNKDPFDVTREGENVHETKNICRQLPKEVHFNTNPSNFTSFQNHEVHPSKSKSDYTVHFKCGPLGLRLEPLLVVEDGNDSIGCKVADVKQGVRQYDTIHTIHMGDEIMAIDNNIVRGWKFKDIITLLKTQSEYFDQDITFRRNSSKERNLRNKLHPSESLFSYDSLLRTKPTIPTLNPVPNMILSNKENASESDMNVYGGYSKNDDIILDPVPSAENFQIASEPDYSMADDRGVTPIDNNSHIPVGIVLEIDGSHGNSEMVQRKEDPIQVKSCVESTIHPIITDQTRKPLKTLQIEDDKACVSVAVYGSDVEQVAPSTHAFTQANEEDALKIADLEAENRALRNQLKVHNEKNILNIENYQEQLDIQRAALKEKDDEIELLKKLNSTLSMRSSHGRVESEHRMPLSDLRLNTETIHPFPSEDLQNFNPETVGDRAIFKGTSLEHGLISDKNHRPFENSMDLNEVVRHMGTQTDDATEAETNIEEKLSMLYRENEELKHSLETKESAHEMIILQRDELQRNHTRQVSELQCTLSMVQSELQTFKDLTRHSNNRIEDLEEQLEMKSDQMRHLERELKESIKEKFSLNQERETLFRASLATEERMDELDTQLQAYKEMIETLHCERDSLWHTRSSTTEEMDQKLTNLQNSNEDLSTRVALLNAALEQYNHERATAEQRENELRMELESMIERNVHERSVSQQEVKELFEALDRAQAKALGLEKSVTLMTEVGDKERAMAEMREKELSKALGRSEATVAELHNLIDSMNEADKQEQKMTQNRERELNEALDRTKASVVKLEGAVTFKEELSTQERTMALQKERELYEALNRTEAQVVELQKVVASMTEEGIHERAMAEKKERELSETLGRSEMSVMALEKAASLREEQGAHERAMAGQKERELQEALDQSRAQVVELENSFQIMDQKRTQDKTIAEQRVRELREALDRSEAQVVELQKVVVSMTKKGIHERTTAEQKEQELSSALDLSEERILELETTLTLIEEQGAHEQTMAQQRERELNEALDRSRAQVVELETSAHLMSQQGAQDHAISDQRVKELSEELGLSEVRVMELQTVVASMTEESNHERIVARDRERQLTEALGRSEASVVELEKATALKKEQSTQERALVQQRERELNKALDRAEASAIELQKVIASMTEEGNQERVVVEQRERELNVALDRTKDRVVELERAMTLKEEQSTQDRAIAEQRARELVKTLDRSEVSVIELQKVVVSMTEEGHEARVLAEQKERELNEVLDLTKKRVVELERAIELKEEESTYELATAEQKVKQLSEAHGRSEIRVMELEKAASLREEQGAHERAMAEQKERELQEALYRSTVQVVELENSVQIMDKQCTQDMTIAEQKVRELSEALDRSEAQVVELQKVVVSMTEESVHERDLADRKERQLREAFRRSEERALELEKVAALMKEKGAHELALAEQKERELSETLNRSRAQVVDLCSALTTCQASLEEEQRKSIAVDGALTGTQTKFEIQERLQIELQNQLMVLAEENRRMQHVVAEKEALHEAQSQKGVILQNEVDNLRAVLISHSEKKLDIDERSLAANDKCQAKEEDLDQYLGIFGERDMDAKSSVTTMPLLRNDRSQQNKTNPTEMDKEHALSVNFEGMVHESDLRPSSLNDFSSPNTTKPVKSQSSILTDLKRLKISMKDAVTPYESRSLSLDNEKLPNIAASEEHMHELLCELSITKKTVHEMALMIHELNSIITIRESAIDRLNKREESSFDYLSYLEKILAHDLFQRNTLKDIPKSDGVTDSKAQLGEEERNVKNSIQKGAAAALLIQTLHNCDKRKLATGFRLWSCETSRIKALESQKEFARHMASQLHQQRSKIKALNNHLFNSGLLNEDDRRRFSLAPSPTLGITNFTTPEPFPTI